MLLPVKINANQSLKSKIKHKKKPKLLHKETLDLEKPKRKTKINSMLIEHNVMCKPQLSQRDLAKVATAPELHEPSDTENLDI